MKTRITMADLVERNKVLETVFNVMSDNKVIHKHRALNRNIKQLPSADTERHAHWIKSEIPCEEYTCSNCGGACWYYDSSETVCKSKYCPNCGCKMDEVEE